MAKALHIQVQVVETPVAAAAENCNKVVVVVNYIEPVEVGEMGMVVDGRERVVVMVVAVNALHTVVVKVGEVVALYKVVGVVVVLYKVVVEMGVVVNTLVVEESEQVEVVAVINRDKQVAVGNVVAAVASVVAVGVSVVEAAVASCSIAQVVVGRIQEPEEAAEKAEAVKVAVEALHSILARVVAVRAAVVREVEEAVSTPVAAEKAAVVKVEAGKAAVEGVNKPVVVVVVEEEVEAAAAAVVEASTLVVAVMVVVVVVNRLEVGAVVNTQAVEVAVNRAGVVGENVERDRVAAGAGARVEEEEATKEQKAYS